MRFGKVFQQTYTRFNDLKLAEAHAVQAEEDLVKLQTRKETCRRCIVRIAGYTKAIDPVRKNGKPW